MDNVWQIVQHHYTYRFYTAIDYHYACQEWIILLIKHWYYIRKSLLKPEFLHSIIDNAGADYSKGSV